MNSLSEKELLLLANYEYFYCSTYSGTISENIDKLKLPDGSYDMEKVIAQGATGDIISDEDAVDILNCLNEDEKLSKLHMARTINKGGIRATLFANEDESEATLVFRGTGGTYKAWRDNVLGEYQSGTALQRAAADFVNYECAGFENITVTGHSKGGNLSQYVTIMCADRVARCVSFDGQGFGENFINENKREIAEAKDKITCINGFNDFVNILLTPVAGTVLYVKNEEVLGVDMHSCYTMLSNGSFDNNGDFRRDFGVIPQLPAMTMAKWAGDGIVELISRLPKDGEEKAANILAAWVASVFSEDKGEEYEKTHMARAVDEFKKYAGELIGLSNLDISEPKFRNQFLSFDVCEVRECYKLLDDVNDKVLVFPEIAEDILVRLDYSILGRSLTENALKRVIDKLDRIIRMVSKYREVLVEIIGLYESADGV